MIGVAFLAWLIILEAPVITAFLADIPAHIFMAFLAQTGLRALIKLLVAFVAILILFSVPLDDIARRNHAPECQLDTRKKKGQDKKKTEKYRHIQSRIISTYEQPAHGRNR